MKNRIFKQIWGIMLLTAPLAMTACDKGDVHAGKAAIASSDEGVTVSSNGYEAEVVLRPEGSGAVLTVAAGAGWHLAIDGEDTWLDASRDGNTVTLSAEEFISDYTHTTLVRIMAGRQAIGSVKVSQAGTAVTTLALDHEQVIFTELGGETVVTVDSNKEVWEIGADPASASWLTVSKGENSFTLACVTNQVTREFTTTLTITAGTEANCKTIELNVVLQSWSPAYIDLDRTLVIIPEEGGSLRLPVHTNRLWEVSQTGSSTITATQQGNELVIGAGAATSGTGEAQITLRTTSGRDSGVTFDATVKQFTNPMILEYTVTDANTWVEAPLYDSVNCYIDWGDGETTDFSGRLGNYQHLRHEYTATGKFNVKMYGTASRLSSSKEGMGRVTAIVSWGDLGVTDFSQAFRGTSIERIPDGYQTLFRRSTDFYLIFSGCAFLEEIPADLFNNLPDIKELVGTFFGCTSLEEIPAGLFTGTTGVTAIQSIFRETSITSIPEGLFDPFVDLSNALGAFDSCTSLTVVPAHLFSNNPKLSDLYAAFRDSGIVSVEEGFLDDCPDLSKSGELFRDCLSLTTVPATLFDRNRKVTTFDSTFRGCTALTGSVPYSVIGGANVPLYARPDHTADFSTPTGTGCFYQCTKLSDYGSIPAGWK